MLLQQLAGWKESIILAERAVRRVHVTILHGRQLRLPLLQRSGSAEYYSSGSAMPHDVFLQTGFAICTIGRRCARLYSSFICGSASERITLPMDMKKL